MAALVVHWSLTRRGVGCVGLGEKVGENPVKSEVLPAGWSGENGTVYSLVYQDQNSEAFLLKAISVDDVLIVSLLSLKTNKTADTNIQPADFIEKKDEIVFNNLETFISKIEAELIDKVITKIENKSGKKDAKKREEVSERMATAFKKYFPHHKVSKGTEFQIYRIKDNIYRFQWARPIWPSTLLGHRRVQIKGGDHY